MKIPSPKQMLEAGVHFGHQTKHWHPRMEKYIYKKHSNIHVIDLFKTEEKIKNAAEFAKKTASKGKPIIFVGTKPQSRETIEIEAKRCGALFVTERWLGGTLTNFKELKSNRDKLVNLKAKMKKGELDDLTKKERLLISREIEKLEINYGGLVGLNELPGCVFIIDGRRESTAIAECAQTNVPTIVLADTNTNPKQIDYVIPGNDDAIKSTAMITRVIADAVEDGYTEYKESSKEVEKKKPKTKKSAKGVKEPEKKSSKKEETKDKARKAGKGQSPSKKEAKPAPSKKLKKEDTVMEAEELSTRTKNALKKADIRTRTDLKEYSEEELEQIDGVGPSAMEDIKKYLKK